jgi:hypothetical protein
MYQFHIDEMARKAVDAIRGIDEGEDAVAAVSKALQQYWEDKIALVWCVADVMYEQDEDNNEIEIVSREAAIEILRNVLDDHDCEFGISWETIFRARDDWMTRHKDDQR